MQRVLPALACVALVIGTLAVLSPALAAEDDSGGEADSLEAGGSETEADTTAEARAQTDVLTKAEARAARIPEKLWEAHPTYTISVSKRKDVTNWDSQIIMNKSLSNKLGFTLAGTVTSRENSTLQRLDASNATSAVVRYQLNDAINFGMNYGAGVSDFSYLKGSEKSDKKKNQDVTVSSELTRKLFDRADFNLKVTGGTTSNSFASLSNSGRRQDLTASLTLSPLPGLKTSTTFTGRRLFLDSKVDSGSGAIFSSQDRTYTNRIAFTLSYDVMPGIRFGMDASETMDQRQHPDPEEKAQETERKSNKDASVTSSINIIPRLTWDMGVSLDSYKGRYVIRSRSNSNSSSAKMQGSGTLRAWRGAVVSFGGSRTDSRDEYQTADTGNTLQKSLNLRLTQDLGAKADLSLTALSDLVSVFYDNKEANPRDRDRLSNRVSMDIAYIPYENVTAHLGGEYSQEQSVFTQAAASGNNRNTTRYRVSGSYDVRTFRGIKITQTYDIGAVYSLYQFAPSVNSLVRNSNVKTRFDVPITNRVALGIDHTYRYQDQGGYYEVGGSNKYSRAAGSETNTFGLGTSYGIGGFRFNVKQSYYRQDTWTYKDSKKVFKPGNWSVDLSGRAGFKYEFRERTKVSFSVERNRLEGTNVGEAFRQYWNVELEASRVF
jgi:hypothetical protein